MGSSTQHDLSHRASPTPTTVGELGAGDASTIHLAPGHHYLQIALARLDILLHRQIARHQAHTHDQPEQRDRAGRAFHISASEAFALLQPPSGVAIAALDDETDYDAALAHAEGLLAATQRNEQPLPLADIAELLGLDQVARDIFLLSLAPAFDLRYGTIYAYLQDDLTRRWPSLNLILDLLCPPGENRIPHVAHLAASAPLMHQRLVALVPPAHGVASPLLAHAVRPDENLVFWLMTGRYTPPAELLGYLTYSAAPSPDRGLLDALVLADLVKIVGDDALISLDGPDAFARTTLTQALAAHLARPLLTLDLAGLMQQQLDVPTGLKLALRDALITHACLAVQGWEAGLRHGVAPQTLLGPLLAHPGPVIISSEEPWHAQGLARTRRIHTLHIPLPDHHQRERLFRHYLNVAGDHQPSLGRIVRQFVLSSAQIRDIVQSSLDMAAQREQTLDEEQLFVAARTHSTVRLSTLAQKGAARYTLEDLIVNVDQRNQLRDLINTIRYRSQVLDDWGLSQKLAASSGITALFAGPPGTGKTMAAEVVAREVGLDIYKINLSAVVSKYIGETEKNLEEIFNEADRSNTVLFFDEADALFGKRSEVKDARDRYANIEISYLLQRLEVYNGVVILATNALSNLDDAFSRRLHARINFVEPGPDQRQRIWQTLFPPQIPRAESIDWVWLAERFTFTGAMIRNAITTAAYLAAAEGGMVEMRHLIAGVRRELQKTGRMVNERDLQP